MIKTKLNETKHQNEKPSNEKFKNLHWKKILIEAFLLFFQNSISKNLHIEFFETFCNFQNISKK